MGPKRSSSEADEQIIKQGRIMKSPPSYIFTKKASWKWRLLKLCKTSLGSFILRYYAYESVNEEWKGDIHMSDIKSIEVGRSTMERIATITRLFNNAPDNILCIKTDKRDFYLVDNSEENIAEWHKYLTDAWMKVHQKVTIPGPTQPSENPLRVNPDQADHQRPTCSRKILTDAFPELHIYRHPLLHLSRQEEVMRPKSYPADHPRTETALVEESNRKRSHTAPESWKGNRLTLDDHRGLRREYFVEEMDVISESQYSKTLPIYSHTPSDKPREARRHSATALPQADPESRRLSEDMTDPAYDSDHEPIYDTPRSIPLKMFGSQESQKETGNEEESGNEEKESGDEQKQSGDEQKQSGDEEETSDLESEEGGVYEHMSSLVIGEVAHLPSKPPRNLRATPKFSEPHSESDLVSITVTVPTGHLQQYLGLQEVGDRLCVSKWKGPLHIGCLFHHGDHIESINGFWSGSKDLFFQMLSHCISDEVSLVLRRNMKAAVFHLEGCSCESP